MSSSPPSETGRAHPRNTLRWQLVVRITVLVTAIAIVLAALSTFMVNRMLTANLDDQLLYAVGATDDSPHGPPGWGPAQPPDATALRVGGLPSGSISLAMSPDGTATATVQSVYGSMEAAEYQIAMLTNLTRDGQVRTIHIDELGEYRAVAMTTNGSLLAAAAPLAVTKSVISRMLWIELLLTVAAAALAAGISAVVVRSSLRPLDRLAETASQVAALPLGSGEVRLGVRVPDAQTDQGEVGRVGSAFNAMLDHVESALQARHDSETRVRQFVADASHELRNPLASIRGYAELTKRGRDELPDDTVLALGRIESESQRMSRLVEQMLLLARLDNNPAPATEAIDLTATVLNAVSDARAAGVGHQWDVSLPDEPVTILGDAGQVHQVLANLLGNARKHTPSGTTVQATVARVGDWARVDVTDNGPGIPSGLLGGIFERFTRGDSARAHDQEGSTGLGLAIVAAVSQAHGGRVEVDSRQASDHQPGFTRFTVWLPAVPPPSGTADRP
ncbi:MAG: sensor histidine kinase [Brooklawnia sp.]|jgi:two-component system OmpR family sensor kinase